MGVIIPQKLRNSFECKNNTLCENCDKLSDQNKEFSANLNELKRHAPNEKGYMLPWYKE